MTYSMQRFVSLKPLRFESYGGENSEPLLITYERRIQIGPAYLAAAWSIASGSRRPFAASGGGTDFGGGFCVGGRSFGGPADGVGDGPCCAGDGNADGVARPDEMVMRGRKELRNPDE